MSTPTRSGCSRSAPKSAASFFPTFRPSRRSATRASSNKAGTRCSCAPNTPKEIVEKLRRVSADVMASPAMEQHLKSERSVALQGHDRQLPQEPRQGDPAEGRGEQAPRHRRAMSNRATRRAENFPRCVQADSKLAAANFMCGTARTSTKLSRSQLRPINDRRSNEAANAPRAEGQMKTIRKASSCRRDRPVAGACGFHPRSACPGFSEPADHLGGRLLARRHQRSGHEVRRQGVRREARPAGDRREQAWRRRHHRGRACRAGKARRLHHPLRLERPARHLQVALQEAVLRSADVVHADPRVRIVAADPGGAGRARRSRRSRTWSSSPRRIRTS